MSEDHERRIRALEAALADTRSAGRPPEAFLAAYTTDAGQSIPTGTGFTVVDFEDVLSDVYGLVTTGAGWSYACPAAGVYEVNAGVLFEANAAWDIGERVGLQAFVNGLFVAWIDRRDTFSPSTTLPRAQGAIPIVCATGDAISVRVSQNSGSAITLNTGAGLNYVMIRRVG